MPGRSLNRRAHRRLLLLPQRCGLWRREGASTRRKDQRGRLARAVGEPSGALEHGPTLSGRVVDGHPDLVRGQAAGVRGLSAGACGLHWTTLRQASQGRRLQLQHQMPQREGSDPLRDWAGPDALGLRLRLRRPKPHLPRKRIHLRHRQEFSRHGSGDDFHCSLARRLVRQQRARKLQLLPQKGVSSHGQRHPLRLHSLH
mmetsp:Transcript_989/g.2176  ORF Transcript_989/g.2176 Transcript_989/m.2176 type:complete len:200 (+) Transcript_989:476-1075(+)